MFAPHAPARFQLDKQAGGGGMGQVFRALDAASGQPVAVKLLRKDASDSDRARFMREVQVLADLRHPGIVSYVDHGTWTDGRLFLAMEWLEGEDLAQRQRSNPLGMSDSVEAVRRVAQAMAAIHARGVIHRDLKLSNIFIVGGSLTRGIKLIDFGVVKLPKADEHPTLAGSIIGTPYTMAPEQARGGLVDARADVYSLAAVLFRLVTGRHVFEADHIIAFLGRLVLEDAPLASSVRLDVPEPLDQLIAAALSRQVDDRPADAGALARLLARLPPMSNEAPNSGQSASAIRRTAPRAAQPATDDSKSSYPPAAPAELERRIIAVVLASLPTGSLPARTAEKARAIMGDDATFTSLQGGRVVAALGLAQTRGDEAVRAARAALLLATTVPDARVAIATGRAEPGRRGLAGDALEQAAAQLERAAAGGIRVGRATEPLLQGRFVLRRDDAGAVLLHEDIAALDTQKLLGTRTPTLGRDNEIDLLLATFRDVMTDGCPRGVLVSAAAGMGKSRIHLETIKRLELLHPGLDVLMARGDPMLSRTGLSAIGRALRARMGIRDGEPAALQVERVRRYVAQRPGCQADGAAFLGELCGVAFNDASSEPLRAAREAPQLMHARILQALESVIQHDARIVPQVMVIEDVHHLDDTSVEMIDWLLASRNLRLVVLAFGRPELEERFPELWCKRAVTRVCLSPLAAAACEHLARLVLPELDEARLRGIVRRAEGNVLFLEELLRYAAEGRDDLPLSVQALIQARLDKLPPEQRQVVRAASVFGRECWTDGVSALVGRECNAELEALGRAEVLVAHETSRIDGQAQWVFPHNMMRESAYASLLDKDRSALHRSASEWLLIAGEEDISAIARHSEAGGDNGRAAVLFARASTQAYANGQLEAALDFADRSLACGQDPMVRAQALLQRAQILAWLARYEDQLQASEEASSFAEPGSNLWGEAQRLAGSALRELGRAAEAELRLSWALGHSHSGQLALSTQARILAEHTRALIDVGRPRDAQRAAEEAVKVAQAAGERGTNAMLRALDARFMAIAFLGDFSVSIDAARAVAEHADRAGDGVLATRARINLGFVLNRVGRFEEARLELERALGDARMLRMRAGEGFAVHNLGMSHARMHDLDTGISMQEQADKIADETGHFRLRLSARTYQAQMRVWRGEPGDLAMALRMIESVRAEAISNPISHAEATAVLGQVQLARRAFDSAVNACEEALSRLSTIGSLEEGEEWLRLTLAEALFELGRREDAHRALRSAYDCVQSRCSQMSHHGHREAFLTRLYECRRVLDLAVEHLGLSRPDVVTHSPEPAVPRHSVPPTPLGG